MSRAELELAQLLTEIRRSSSRVGLPESSPLIKARQISEELTVEILAINAVRRGLTYSWEDDSIRNPYALNFTGDDYISIGNVAIGNPESGDYTVEIQFKADDLSLAHFIASKGNASSSDEGWSIFTTPTGDLIVRCNASGDDTQKAGQALSSVLQTGTWYNVAMVIDRSTNTINGFLNGSNTGWVAGGGDASDDDITGFGSIGPAEDLEFGRRNDGTLFFDGLISEARVWKGSSRSAAEILANMNNILTGLESGLSGYWPMLEASGSVVEDITLNRNDGTITGAEWIVSNAQTVFIWDESVWRSTS